MELTKKYIMKKYKVTSYTFKGSELGLYTYEISLNKSTINTSRLFDGIAKGLNDHEHLESLPKWKRRFNNVLDKLKF